ncbi:MAG TPA: acetoacetate decarboxylase family protein [Rhodanobacter sp.]|nr:acetoacetate decarboxylase family protein [Rhodanobacter sp.]
MAIPRRLRQQGGRHALVDGIPFTLPVASAASPALMAAFPINPARAAELLPGNELHPLRLGRHALLLVSVIDYRHTNIGKYIEYSLGIGCTHGPRPVSLVRAMLFRKSCGLGQYVFDLPVSTEISVKGGKGIWGMPKHQANLDFEVTDTSVRSRYDLDGSMVAEVEIGRPGREVFSLSTGAINWCAFRGMLMKSSIYFHGKMGFRLWRKASARLTLGSHPRAEVLRRLEIGERPLFVGYFPESSGVLDDHLESWFLSYDERPVEAPEGLESVVGLGLGETWLPPPGSAAAKQDATSRSAVDAGA